jgi:hypothetical protein
LVCTVWNPHRESTRRYRACSIRVIRADPW